jgi:hypothetical protein
LWRAKKFSQFFDFASPLNNGHRADRSRVIGWIDFPLPSALAFEAAHSGAAPKRFRMARALKVFKTHIGFYDLIVAAPSMKAAAAAWNSDPRIFSQGFAGRTENEKDVAAALAEPGTVLKRPHGQGGASRAEPAWRAEPAAIAAPKAGKANKAVAAKAEQARKRKAAEGKKAQAAADRKARQDAAGELAEIERQEAELREKRRKLRKKFHLHSVKG